MVHRQVIWLSVLLGLDRGPSSQAKGFWSTLLTWGAEWTKNPWLAKMTYTERDFLLCCSSMNIHCCTYSKWISICFDETMADILTSWLYNIKNRILVSLMNSIWDQGWCLAILWLLKIRKEWMHGLLHEFLRWDHDKYTTQFFVKIKDK